MRKFLLALVLFLTVIFLITRTAEVQAIADTLQRGDWRFLLLAFGVMLGWMGMQALVFEAIYSNLGIQESFKSLVPVVASAFFINAIAPSAGVSGMAIFIVEARRRGYSSGRAAIASALFILFDYAAFACMLALGLVVLIRRNNLNTAEVIATILLLILMVTVFSLVFLGLRSEDKFRKVLVWLAHRLNRLLRPFIHRDYLSEQRASEFAHEASSGLHEITRQPQALIKPFLLALARQSLQLAILFLVFLAFEVPISPGTVIAGFAIGSLFIIISITPLGLGVVEGVLPLVLSSMYISLGAATVLTLAYRAFTLWLPLLLGAIAFRALGFSRDLRKETAKSEP